MDYSELETRLFSFRQKPPFPWWPGLRFKPSSYDEVFHLCMTNLTESFDELKAEDFLLSYRTGTPSSDFYLTMDMLKHLKKSIYRESYFPSKSPLFWIGVAVLFFLFTNPYEPFVWWLSLVETVMIIAWTIGDCV